MNESGDFMALSEENINVSAVVSPSNSFTLGKTKTNRRKGTATLTVDLPNPGDLPPPARASRRRALPARGR